MKTIEAVALGGSLTKLGVNGGLVASAGFSLPTRPGPSHRSRPRADNTHTVLVELLFTQPVHGLADYYNVLSKDAGCSCWLS